MICTPKVRHFWRCIFLWVKKAVRIKYKFDINNMGIKRNLTNKKVICKK